MNKKLVAMENEMLLLFSALWPGENKPLVFGDGLDENPPLMLIGEAPGEQEALQRKPFVGKAGKNLTEFLTAVQMNRKDIYISNVVKIRPVKVSEKGRASNRPPNREELALFTPWLMKEILAVRPCALVTMGNVPLKTFLGSGETIGAHHGLWNETTVSAEGQKPLTLPLFALYHPASVIYNRALTEVYQQDIQALARSLKVKTDS